MALTGIGLVSRGGTKKEDFFSSLKEAAPRTEDRDRPAAPGQLLAVLNISEPRLKIARYMDPVSKNAIVAMRQVLSDAGIDQGCISKAPYDYGIVLGTTRGPCATREGLYGSLASRQGKLVSATLFSHSGYNIAGAMTAIAYGIKGPNLTIANRGDLGLAVLRRARQLLINGRAHVVFAGFSEGQGSVRRENSPSAEFAYLLCLESKDHAMERGAAVLAEVAVQDDDVDQSHTGQFLPDGPLTGGSARLFGDGESLSLPLPGLHAFGERYLSLFMIGLLANDSALRSRFPAFVAASGNAGATIRLLCAQEHTAAA